MTKKARPCCALHIKAAGYGGGDDLHVSLRSGTGSISDGVGFWHNREGAWVIGFADLKRLYKAAGAARKP